MQDPRTIAQSLTVRKSLSSTPALDRHDGCTMMNKFLKAWSGPASVLRTPSSWGLKILPSATC